MFRGEGATCRKAPKPQKRWDRRLEEVAEAVGGGYCRLQMPLKLALRGRWLDALEGGGGYPLFRCIPASTPALPPHLIGHIKGFVALWIWISASAMCPA